MGVRDSGMNGSQERMGGRNGQGGMGVRNRLMGKLQMKLKIVINYLKSLRNQNYTLTKLFIMRQDIKYRK